MKKSFFFSNLEVKNIDDLLTVLPTYLLSILILLTPFVILPFGENIFKHSKSATLFTFILLLLLVFAIRVFRKNVFKLIISPFFLPLNLLLISSLFSSLLTGSNYPVRALIGWGGIYIAFSLLVLLGSSMLKQKTSQIFSLTLSFVGILLSIATILEYAGTGPSQLVGQLLGIPLSNATTFNLSGSIFIAAQLLLLSAVTSVVNVLKKSPLKLWYLFSLPIILTGLTLAAWQSSPGQIASPLLAPFKTSWTIATSTLNLPKTALIGHGVENYGQVYNLLKPASINTSDSWGVQFVQASSTPLTLMTSMGILGLSAWSLLLYQVLKNIKKSNKAAKPVAAVALVALLLQLIFPINIVTLVILAVALTFWVAEEQKKYSSIELHPLEVKIAKAGEKEEKVSEYSKGFSYFLAGIVIISVLLLGTGLFRVYAGFTHLFLAEKAAANNNAIAIYNNQRQAIAYNPYLASMRRSYALTNLQIAAAISAQENPNPDDTKQVTQLIQQAIREARAATLINGSDSQNWRTLGDVYKQLIGAAEGAENWTVSGYSRAIELSPSDPTLRVDLGGVFLAQEEYQQATTLFEQATLLKPDYANAHYNLANALKTAGNYQLAERYYQQTLALIETSGPDYEKANNELAEVQAKLQTQKRDQATENPEQQVNLIEENLPQEQAPIESQTQLELSSEVEEALDPTVEKNLDLENTE
ncbi:MAG: tetratricopeptide repeat protein [Patescibacteria group bacterium]